MLFEVSPSSAAKLIFLSKDFLCLQWKISHFLCVLFCVLVGAWFVIMRIEIFHLESTIILLKNFLFLSWDNIVCGWTQYSCYWLPSYSSDSMFEQLWCLNFNFFVIFLKNLNYEMIQSLMLHPCCEICTSGSEQIPLELLPHPWLARMS